MNSERTQAYGRVVRTLEDVGPTKLHHGDVRLENSKGHGLRVTVRLPNDSSTALMSAHVALLARHTSRTGLNPWTPRPGGPRPRYWVGPCCRR